MNTSTIKFLSSDNFNTSKSDNGDVLTVNMNGFALILFYSQQCPNSRELLPIFKRLPSSLGLCQFGMINISKHRSVIEMSKNTILPLSYVPFLVLYINGYPYQAYTGPRTDEHIKNFVIESANAIQTKQQFTSKSNNVSFNQGNPMQQQQQPQQQQQQQPQQQQQQPPGFGRAKMTGKPVYASFDRAYQNA